MEKHCLIMLLCVLCGGEQADVLSHSSFAFRNPVASLPDGSQNAKNILGPFTFHTFVTSGTSFLPS